MFLDRAWAFYPIKERKGQELKDDPTRCDLCSMPTRITNTWHGPDGKWRRRRYCAYCKHAFTNMMPEIRIPSREYVKRKKKVYASG